MLPERAPDEQADKLGREPLPAAQVRPLLEKETQSVHVGKEGAEERPGGMIGVEIEENAPLLQAAEIVGQNAEHLSENSPEDVPHRCGVGKPLGQRIASQ